MTGVNDAPVVNSSLPDMVVNEDDPDSLVDLANVFDDVDAGDTLVLTVSGNTNSLF